MRGGDGNIDKHFHDRCVGRVRCNCCCSKFAFPPKTMALRILDREGQAVFEWTQDRSLIG